MAQIIREIRVDVSQPNVFQAIVAKQLDCNSRFLKITLVDFGVKIEVPETAKVTINANRPDGKSQSFVGVANNDGTITVPLAQWMLEVAGELKCDVSVINTTDNKRLTSTDFFVNVQEAANKSTDISENPDGEIRVITPTQKIDENSSDDEYPSAKAVYELDNITATATGSAISIFPAGAPIPQLILRGKTTQNGTPTPDAPIDLVSVGDDGAFDVSVCGQALVDFKNFTTRGTPVFSYKGNKIHYENTEGITNAVDTGAVTLPAGTYTAYIKNLSGSGNEIIGVYGLYMSRGVPRQVFTLTTPKTVRLMITTSNMNTKGSYDCYCGIVAGSVPLEDCPIIDEDLPDIQTLIMPYTLRSTKNTKDEIDFNNALVTEKIIKLEFTGDEKMYGTGDYAVFTGTYGVKAGLLISGALCNRLTELEPGSHYYNRRVGFSISGESDRIRITLGDTTTLDEVKAKLAEWYAEGNPLTIIAERATPIETALTETELNAYRHLMTNKGTTTILSECEDTEITYYVNKPNAQAIGSLHEQINKDYFKLQQAIISTGGSTL